MTLILQIQIVNVIQQKIAAQEIHSLQTNNVHVIHPKTAAKMIILEPIQFIVFAIAKISVAQEMISARTHCAQQQSVV